MLTAIVPFWHGHKTIARLLDSLPRDMPVIIVNDAGSKPPEVQNGNAQVINLQERGYFSGACNVGFEAAGDSDVVVINQDVWFTSEQCFHTASAFLGQGSAGCYGDGVFNNPAWPTGYVQGTFMAIARRALNKIGGFNAHLFPLWGATAEWQVRACRSGFSVSPVTGLSGLVHEPRRRFGAAIERALRDEPAKRDVFFHTPPLVSVIVPLYNYGRYLKQALESLMAQTFQAFEVVIVDDASTDGSGDIADSFADHRHGIRVIHHSKNRGTAAANNTGIEAAYGEYITILSADDWYQPERLAKMYEAAISNPGRVICDDIVFCTDGHRKTVRMEAVERELLFLAHQNTMHAGIMFKRRWWKEVGGYPEVMSDGREDWAFNIALARAGYAGKHLDYAGYCYRREGQNRTTRRGTPRWQFLESIKALYPELYTRSGDGGDSMACAGCGRKRVRIQTDVYGVKTKVPDVDSSSTLMEYTGNSVGAATWIGKVSGRSYKAGLTGRYRLVAVDTRDVPGLLATGVFRVVSRDIPNELREEKPVQVQVDNVNNVVIEERKRRPRRARNASDDAREEADDE